MVCPDVFAGKIFHVFLHAAVRVPRVANQSLGIIYRTEISLGLLRLLPGIDWYPSH